MLFLCSAFTDEIRLLFQIVFFTAFLTLVATLDTVILTREWYHLVNLFFNNYKFLRTFATQEMILALLVLDTLEIYIRELYFISNRSIQLGSTNINDIQSVTKFLHYFEVIVQLIRGCLGLPILLLIFEQSNLAFYQLYYLYVTMCREKKGWLLSTFDIYFVLQCGRHSKENQ